jgi:hypothetical protein
MTLPVSDLNAFKAAVPCLEPKAYDEDYLGGLFRSMLTRLEAYGSSNNHFLGELLDYAKINWFFTSPASTRFHGCFQGGLAAHSVGVLRTTLDLMEPFGFSSESVSLDWLFGLVVAALFHDLCKAGLYTVDYRNVKNAQGIWNKEPYYRVKDGATGIGHGTESLRRISKFIQLPYEWELAVAWHMGSFGLTSEENIQYMNSCRLHREVLLLHTADMLQTSSGGA